MILKEVQNDIIHRQVFPTVPVTVEYSLMEKGKDFQTVLIAMYHWGQRWGKPQDENNQDQGKGSPNREYGRT